MLKHGIVDIYYFYLTFWLDFIDLSVEENSYDWYSNIFLSLET